MINSVQFTEQLVMASINGNQSNWTKILSM